MSKPEATSAPAPAEQTVSPIEAIDYRVTPGFVALLDRLGCSLVISNYQSSTVMAFSSLGDGRPLQMFAPFQAAMGLALAGRPPGWKRPSPSTTGNC